MNYIEIIAVVFGLLSIWFARKENVWVFPLGIVNIILFIIINLKSELYAFAAFNVVNIGFNIFGWYKWTETDESNKQLEISRNSLKQNIFILLFMVVIYAVVILILRWANSENLVYLKSFVPWVDALSISILTAALVLMSYKKIENWILWMIGNVIAIVLYTYKGVYPALLQYAVFMIMSVLGFLAWRKKLRNNEI